MLWHRYIEYVGRQDWAQAVTQARTPGAYLSNVHAVACAHVLRRSLLIHASNRDIEMFGRGYWGVAGLHMPIRLPIEEVSTLLTHCLHGSCFAPSFISLLLCISHLTEIQHSSICTSLYFLMRVSRLMQHSPAL